ncbi:MAG: response regulator [bacterium]
MPSQIDDEHLQRVIRLSHEMISLADEGDDARRDTGCGIVFGKLRDSGYSLRNLAKRELEAHQGRGQHPAFGREAKGDTATKSMVLIVDDDPDVVTFLSTWFRDHGCRTVTAGNGFEAIEQAVKLRPDLITLDMSMPEKSGVSTYRDLKGDTELRTIPVIIVTGIGRVMEDFLRSRRQVPDPEGFIPKPIDLELLTETVGRLLNHDRGPEP